MRLIVGPFEEYEIPDSLLEGKGLYGLLVRDEIRQAVIDAGFNMDTGKFRQIRAGKSTANKRRFDAMCDETQRTLVSTTMDFLSQRKNPRIKHPMSKTRWQETVKKALRSGYAQAFEMGLESSGVSKFRVGVAEMDREYVDKAVREEMRYFNKVLAQIDAGKLKGSLMKRLTAYTETLRHMYYAGRVMGTPSGMIIDWIAPMDRNTCKGCEFLFHNSPYTKATLPTTPAAGNTPCLNKCRCRLVVRTVPKEEYERVGKGHNKKSTYARKLSALKANKSLI